MGLHNYATASIGLAQELEKLLDDAALEATARDLAALGEADWLRWTLAHDAEILDFVSSTTSQRAKLKKWRDYPEFGRLVVASMLHCQNAHSLLRFLSDHADALGPGGSYRDTTALAGSLYWDAKDMPLVLWPGDLEDRCPSPFPP